MEPAQSTTQYVQEAAADLTVFDHAAAVWAIVAVLILALGFLSLRRPVTNRWTFGVFTVWLLVGVFGLLSMVLLRAQM